MTETEPYTDFQLVVKEASNFVNRANIGNRNESYWTVHFPVTNFWSTTMQGRKIFSDFTELDETVLSLQNFFIEEEKDLQAPLKEAQAEVEKWAEQSNQEEDYKAQIKKSQEERVLTKWYAENKELTALKLMIGAYILFASGVPLKDTKRDETEPPAHQLPTMQTQLRRLRTRAEQAEAASKDPGVQTDIRKALHKQAKKDTEKLDEADGTEKMRKVLIKIADKECWPYGGESIDELYDMLPDGDNLKIIDDIVKNVDVGIEPPPALGIELPPSVAPAPAGAPRPAYRKLSAAPAEPSVIGTPPTKALSPIKALSPPRSPLHERVQNSNSPHLQKQDPNHVVNQIFAFLKGAVKLRKHSKKRENHWTYRM